jgi:XTP/dITP diphosphohydrolase
MKTVLIATKNKGKVNEFATFFKRFGYEVQSLLDLEDIDIDETGNSFEENALIKARTLAERTQSDVLADDSGLEVYYLNNEPGIYSARYSGLEKNDQANNEKLLKNLEGVEERGAQFVCALAYVTKDLKEFVVRGTCEGQIGYEPKGENGFGYDPLFILPDLNKTFAELTPLEKEAISHRGIALKQLEVVLFGD